MSVFLSVHHLAAWAGVCPGNHESAGKQKSGRARKGNVHLRTMLVSAATSAARTKRPYLKDKFHRPARPATRRDARGSRHRSQDPRGLPYHMLAKEFALPRTSEKPTSTRSPRPEPSANLKRRIERLGYSVTLEPKAEPACYFHGRRRTQ